MRELTREEYRRRMAIGKAIAQQLKPLKTHGEIAKVFGLTKQRIEQIESLALYKIASRMKQKTGFETL
jgi:DNA-directed RNA polymerase sigma subunit (sigma70/sigma32)